MFKLLAFLVFLISFQATGQTLTYNDFKGLIPELITEDWRSVYDKSAELLKISESDTSDIHAVVVYINIFSGAGLVSQKEMTYEELEKNIMKFEGQKIIMSAHPITTLDGALNQVKFNEVENTASVAAANTAGTSILCFEHFNLKDKIDTGNFPEKSMVRCGGKLTKIEFNPNKSQIWILRLTVGDAFARKLN